MPILTDPKDLRRVLMETRVVAVLGAHDQSARAAWYVPAYLQEQGMEILPVNPAKVGRQILGAPVVASLAELKRPVDLVDVFRRSGDVPGHLDDILAMEPLPKVVWLQQGIRNDEVAQVLEAAGIDVVQDQCTLALHRRWSIPSVEELDQV